MLVDGGTCVWQVAFLVCSNEQRRSQAINSTAKVTSNEVDRRHPPIFPYVPKETGSELTSSSIVHIPSHTVCRNSEFRLHHGQ